MKLTNHCNLSCSYCYLSEKNTTTINPTTTRKLSEFAEHISQINHHRPFDIHLSGGETSIIPIELLEYTLELLSDIPNTRLHLNTNGVTFTAAHIELCKRYDIHVSLSLDGGQMIHDHQRGNSHKQAMDLHMKLGAHKIPHGFVTVITDYTAAHKEELYDFFRSTGITTSMNPAVGHVTPDNYTDTLLYINDRLEADNHPFKELTLSDIKNTISGKSSHTRICYMGNCFRDYIAIDYNGDVTTCERFFGLEDKNKFIIGNINSTPFPELIHSPKRNELLQVLHGKKTKCMDCCYYHLCGGGCSHQIYSTTNGITGTDGFCDARKRLYKTLIGG